MSLKGRSCWDVNIRMDDREKLSLEAIGQFVEASREIRFESENRQQLYGWVERVLVQQEYTPTGQSGAGPAAALHRRDDRIEPCAGDAADRSLHGQRKGRRRRSIGGGVSRNSTRGPTSSCWPRSTKRTRR